MAGGGFALEEVKVSSSPQERFREYLRSRGKRITDQRQALVDYIYQRHDHFDAEDLIFNIGQKRSKIRVSRPTVYRTLNELVEAGLLRKMALGGRAVYEHDYGYPQHDHLHCTICDELIEFQITDLSKLCEAVGGEHNFQVTGHRLIVTGICERCANQRGR